MVFVMVHVFTSRLNIVFSTSKGHCASEILEIADFQRNNFRSVIVPTVELELTRPASFFTTDRLFL